MNLRNFAYLDDHVAGTAHPGYGAGLAESLRELYAEGFRGVISAHEAPLDPPVLAEEGFEGLHLAVRDFTAPTGDQLQEAVDFIAGQKAKGHKTLVHCMGGYGRTGTVLGAYLIAEGRTTEEAINEVREARPGSIEVESQERALEKFEARVREAKNG